MVSIQEPSGPFPYHLTPNTHALKEKEKPNKINKPIELPCYPLSKSQIHDNCLTKTFLLLLSGNVFSPK